MSSTGRGGKRAEADFYRTPAYAVERLLERWGSPGRRWLELGAGDGAIIRAVNDWRARQDRTALEWTAVELRPECEQPLRAAGAGEVFIGAAQQWRRQLRAGARWDVCIMNPPFSDALSLVQLGLDVALWTVCLERTPWLCDAADRYSFFIAGARAPVSEYRVGRIDFDGRGGDSIPYSWFAWLNDGMQRDSWRTHALRPTPAQERVRGHLPPARQGHLF